MQTLEIVLGYLPQFLKLICFLLNILGFLRFGEWLIVDGSWFIAKPGQMTHFPSLKELTVAHSLMPPAMNYEP